MPHPVEGKRSKSAGRGRKKGSPGRGGRGGGRSSSKLRRGRPAKKLRNGLDIEHVHVEKLFELKDPRTNKKAGDGCYMSATVQSTRFYGVMVDQGALRTASELHFEHEAAGLALNQKMKTLKQQISKEREPKKIDELEKPAETEPEELSEAMEVDSDSKPAAKDTDLKGDDGKSSIQKSTATKTGESLEAMEVDGSDSKLAAKDTDFKEGDRESEIPKIAELEKSAEITAGEPSEVMDFDGSDPKPAAKDTALKGGSEEASAKPEFEKQSEAIDAQAEKAEEAKPADTVTEEEGSELKNVLDSSENKVEEVAGDKQLESEQKETLEADESSKDDALKSDANETKGTEEAGEMEEKEGSKNIEEAKTNDKGEAKDAQGKDDSFGIVEKPTDFVADTKDDNDRKRPPSDAPEGIEESDAKKPRIEKAENSIPEAATSTSPLESSSKAQILPSIQKFRYVESSQPNQQGAMVTGNSSAPDYRILLATYADAEAASEDDAEKSKAIETVCRDGGGFVGKYFYQYEMKKLTLEPQDNVVKPPSNTDEIRTSMGFQSFLETTSLPNWFPLSNLMGGQHKVLGMLSMKKDPSGKVVWDNSVTPKDSFLALRDIVPMEPRTRYRVCVVGGGIAGLSCCLELFKECEKKNIDVEIVLLEAQSRLGGRLQTDRETFKSNGNKPFPVDLGASWIHGIDLNPLAALAREAGVEFVATSEDVKMLQGGTKEVDKEDDAHAGRLFDKLLDLAANDSWGSDNDDEEALARRQYAVRWYGSVLSGNTPDSTGIIQKPSSTRPPFHRRSADTSVDSALGKVIAEKNLSEFSQLSSQERRMLLWNIKNVEYALAANVKDLSMKFWDIDERHAFEGDHVLLRQGYSAVVDHLEATLKKYGESFKHVLNCPVGKVEYGRKTSTVPYSSGELQQTNFVDLSDTCSVTSQDGSKNFKCDFLVMAAPLGVLKESIQEEKKDALHFYPPLPDSKRDAIASIGFGLLNKVYLQFPTSFWYEGANFEPDQKIFGNASGTNPHHYMFLDIGKTLKQPDEDSAPSILMSLISGMEAVICEQMTDEELVKQTMETLRALFTEITVPDPIAFKVTRWGSNKFTRGSYTYLPPGATNEDFQVLQAPINSNGEAFMLDASETMRLFFAGEHTTALHPSTAHGAMLSGMRAAKEVAAEMNVKVVTEDTTDRVIPLSVYRLKNPKSELECSMCHRPGTRIREGSLFAFKKGARQALVHNNCAEYSPEVEVSDGEWSNVLAAVNRSKTLECYLCAEQGATIGCTEDGCHRCYHFSCGEDTGWRFDIDGKEFKCDLHRIVDNDECSRISMEFYRAIYSSIDKLSCAFCGSADEGGVQGDFIAFQRKAERLAVHENCAQYTSTAQYGELGEDSMSRFDKEYRNIFKIVKAAEAERCSRCNQKGANIACSSASCTERFHFACAEKTGWAFKKHEKGFRCQEHRKIPDEKAEAATKEDRSPEVKGAIKHSLFSAHGIEANPDVPGNLDISVERPRSFDDTSVYENSSDDSDKEDDEEELAEDYFLDVGPLVCLPKSKLAETRLVRKFRASLKDNWNLDLYANPVEGTENSMLSVATTSDDPFDPLMEGDVIKGINGEKIGSIELNTLEKVLTSLSQEVDLILEVQRPFTGNTW